MGAIYIGTNSGPDGGHPRSLLGFWPQTVQRRHDKLDCEALRNLFSVASLLNILFGIAIINELANHSHLTSTLRRFAKNHNGSLAQVSG